MLTRERRKTSFRLPDYLLDGLRQEAKRQKTSMNSLLELFLKEGLFEEPNDQTRAAIEECRSGVELDDFDPDSLDQYIYAAEAVDAV